MQRLQPSAEHEFLRRFVGRWTIISEEGQGGQEEGRMLGDYWLLLEASAPLRDGSPHSWLFTIGFDPSKKKFVGSFVSSVMAEQWVYEGSLEGEVLILETEGPSMQAEGERAKYRDFLEIQDGVKVLRSSILTESGEWQEFMRAQSKRAES